MHENAPWYMGKKNMYVRNAGVLCKITRQQNFYLVNNYATENICVVNNKYGRLTAENYIVLF